MWNSSLFGNHCMMQCLLYIANYGEGHINGIAKTFQTSPGQVQRQLNKLSLDDILVSKFTGNVRVYTFNSKMPLTKALKVFLESILAELPEDLTQRHFRQRRRPCYSTKRYAVQEKRQLVFARDGGRCALCKKFDDDWQMDHVVPLREGGSDDVSNLRVLCLRCHKAQTKALWVRLWNFPYTTAVGG